MSDTRLGVASVLLLAVVLLIVVALLIPLVATELRSPATPPQDSDARAFASSSKRLGLWLSFAFRSARIAGESLGAICILWFLALFLVEPTLNQLFPSSWFRLALRTDDGLGLTFRNYGAWIASGVGTVGVLALLGRFSRMGGGLRPALGIAVDVDNYLRELPSQRTPRARIIERFTSLLRYLCDWRAVAADPTSGYDAIVIIAHSQGAVITADLLRYLRFERTAKDNFENRLARLGTERDQLPIDLLTMGNPLRQLYALRFPHLYSWVGFDSRRGPVLANMLGVRSWLNAYRSGDYVGRAVWRDNDQDAATFEPFSEDESQPAGVTEMCIGPGAHTHYWDESADIIGTLLDNAIETSTQRAQPNEGYATPQAAVVGAH